MTRDPLTAEPIIWSGRPEVIETPPFLKAVAGVLFVVAAVAALFAVVVSGALGASPTSLLLVGAWAATLGLLSLNGTKIWLTQARYLVTERRVVVQRGIFRRTIDRHAISFARIIWSQRYPDVGTVELVRAVQTGPFGRRLTIVLRGVRQPNRVWAIVRGAERLAPRGSSSLPLPQRLDTDERVVWAARPRPRLRSYLPASPREWGHTALAVALLVALAIMIARAVPNAGHLLAAGLRAGSAEFLALILAEVLTAVLMLAMAGYYAYEGLARGSRLVRDTRYMITNKHVLISRGREELHLERSKIVDVIDAEAGDGVRDVFLVLDGPRARALATSGAFGEMERSNSLRPVFLAVSDAESVSRILSSPDLPRAA
jgi:hypothetical protein